MSNTTLRAALLVSTSLVAAGFSTAAFAQAKPNANALEEVVVTATRQTSTVNKVALSVSAVTQKSLDQQGIRNVQDLSQQVPGFTFRVSGADNNPQLTMRGIGGNALNGTSGSAPTTGVYIDDIAFQKRNANGLETGSGSPVPLLYDLDRVEVLRGPQGTLYGGSSEGGTLRFITPQPSLTTYTGTARIGISTVQGGGLGNEEGIALGGPLIRDKVGFRVSAFRQDRPGWVNGYSEYDGHQFSSQNNKGSDYALNAKLLFQLTPNFKATIGVINQSVYDQDTSVIRGPSGAVVAPRQTISNAGTVNGVKYSFPATTFGGYTIPAQTWFSSLNAVPNGLYLSATNVQYVPSPRRTIFTTPSVTLDYNWHDKLNFKSITSYTSDTTGGWTFTGGVAVQKSVVPFVVGACPTGVGQVTPILQGLNTCTINPQYTQPDGTVGPANTHYYYLFNNRRGQVTQEFRVSTIDPSSRLQFVAGLFVEHENNHVNVGSNWNQFVFANIIRGTDDGYAGGGSTEVPFQLTPGNNAVDLSGRNIDILEDELSGFGEASFQVTSKLKITAGLRATSYQQKYSQIAGGVVIGAPNGFVGTSDTGAIETNPKSLTPFPTNYAACPTDPYSAAGAAGIPYAAAGCPYQYSAGLLKENPITPKLGASYQLNASDLLYVTYAEGQRPGGINPPVPPVPCAGDIAILGTTSLTYQHDSVKSTEVGGKFRLFDGQAQVNASAFHIAWDNVQFVVPFVSCSFSYVANAATAASDGAEIQATGRWNGFTVNTNIAYDKAQYTATVKGPFVPGKTQATLVFKGDPLGVPDVTANMGVQYDWHTLDFPSYARLDAAYSSRYKRGTSPGTSSFDVTRTPNYINGDSTLAINGRIGAYYKDLEIAFYVKNLANEQHWLTQNQAVSTYWIAGIIETPRVIGMQMNYRF